MIVNLLATMLLAAGSHWWIAPDGSLIEVKTREAAPVEEKSQLRLVARRPVAASRFTLFRGRFFGRRR